MTTIERAPLAYRIEEAAKSIGLSRVTIYKLIGEGKLKTIKIGRCRLVPASALRDLAENGSDNVPTDTNKNIPTKSASVNEQECT